MVARPGSLRESKGLEIKNPFLRAACKASRLGEDWRYEALAPARTGEDGVEPGPPVGASYSHFGPALP